MCVRNPLKLYGGRSGAKVRRGQKKGCSPSQTFTLFPRLAAMTHIVRRYILYVF